jgi:hypothetical protein
MRSALVPSSQRFGRDGGDVAFGQTQTFGGGSGKTKAQTYDELLADDGLDLGVRAKLRGEATISLAVHLLLGRGHESIVRAASGRGPDRGRSERGKIRRG